MYFERLTDVDKVKIEKYITYYSGGSQDSTRAPLEHVLKPWDRAKSEYLSKLFRDELIVTRHVNFHESEAELSDKMYDTLYRNDTRCIGFRYKIQDYFERLYVNTYWNSPECIQKDFVYQLFDTWTLSQNAVQDNNRFYGHSRSFTLHIGDIDYKVPVGMKPMRVIAKIAEKLGIGTEIGADGISDLEYFRRRHSLGLNTKSLEGDLCLSIHPLDYMTMSDNDCGWDSCMNWRNNGEYRQGTVEMMNSPCVVVAYLAADHPYVWGGGETWNSKKWRCLMVVDPEFIVNVKSYPYQNSSLEKAAIAELAKMSGWGDLTPVPYDYLNKYSEYRQAGRLQEVNGRKIGVGFSTGCMYNDFSSADHYVAVNPHNSFDIVEHSYYYSGDSECVWCGEVGDPGDTGVVVCDSCGGYRGHCEWCDGRIYSDEESYTTAEGYEICEYCWENNTSRDDLTEQYYMCDNVQTIYLSRSNTGYSEKHWNHSITVAEKHLNNNDDVWHKYFNINTDQTHQYDEGPWTTIEYVCPCECTPEGLELFGICGEEDLKEYMGLNEPN